jgi:3-hydroxyisobutyrate dehydrogenase-like beta-hydroxyacid dehydrogenase
VALRCSDPVAARHPAGGATESTHEPVAVLGIGAMGHGMTTSAWRAGIRTAADAGRLAAIVVTMVSDTDAVISIARDQGMLAALAPGAIWVQMSTIGVAGIECVADLVDVERPDVTLLDAPVSGSSDPAEHGQSTRGREVAARRLRRRILINPLIPLRARGALLT